MHCKKYLVHEITVDRAVQLNSSDYEWPNYGLTENSGPYNHTATSLLPSFSQGLLWIRYKPSFGSSIRCITFHSRFIHKNYFGKVNSHVFLGPILTLQNIWFSERKLLLWCFIHSISQSVICLLSLLIPTISAFSVIWVQIKSVCFTITSFSLRSCKRSKFLKHFRILRVRNLVIFSTAFFIVWWFLQLALPYSIILLFSIFQQLLDPSHY